MTGSDKVKKRILYALIGLASVASYRAFDKIHIPRVKTDDLVLNIVNDHINVTHKSEAEGIEDIIKIAKESLFEDAWVYSSGKWTENGIQERIQYSFGIIGSYHLLDLKVSGKIVKKGHDTTFYHLHPKNNYNFDEIHQWTEKHFGKTDIELVRLHYSAVSSMPSANDLDVMVEVCNFIKDRSPKSIPQFKVVSVHGITEYTLTKEGNEKFIKGKGCAAHWAYAAEERLRVPKFSRDTIDSISYEMAERMSDEFVQVTYTPHSK
jgi:hypothetical protein